MCLMRRIVLALLVTVIMTVGQSSEVFLDDGRLVKPSESQLSIQFSNGPTANQDVKGLFTLTFTSTGSGTISRIEIEISKDGNSWSPVANLTSTPWLKHVDTTAYDNDSWTFRARAYDSNVNNFTEWFTSGEFNIVNQVPVITSFALTNTGVGSGASALEHGIGSLQTVLSSSHGMQMMMT